jgi:hypothetical protein
LQLFPDPIAELGSEQQPMSRDDREANRYFEAGLLIAVLAGLGMMAYWALM